MNLDLIDFLAVLAVIFSCLSSTSVIHYNLWFLFACYHKRNVETKRLKAVSSSRPLSAILTQVGHYTCRTEARKRQKRNVDIGNKNSPRYYLSLVNTNKYGTTTQHEFYSCCISSHFTDILLSHETFSQQSHTCYNCYTKV